MSAPADAFESSGDADDEMHKELDDLQYQRSVDSEDSASCASSGDSDTYNLPALRSAAEPLEPLSQSLNAKISGAQRDAAPLPDEEGDAAGSSPNSKPHQDSSEAGSFPPPAAIDPVTPTRKSSLEGLGLWTGTTLAMPFAGEEPCEARELESPSPQAHNDADINIRALPAGDGVQRLSEEEVHLGSPQRTIPKPIGVSSPPSSRASSEQLPSPIQQAAGRGLSFLFGLGSETKGVETLGPEQTLTVGLSAEDEGPTVEKMSWTGSDSLAEESAMMLINILNNHAPGHQDHAHAINPFSPAPELCGMSPPALCSLLEDTCASTQRRQATRWQLHHGRSVESENYEGNAEGGSVWISRPDLLDDRSSETPPDERCARDELERSLGHDDSLDELAPEWCRGGGFLFDLGPAEGGCRGPRRRPSESASGDAVDDLVDLLLEEAVLYDEMQRIELEFLQIEMSLPEDRHAGWDKFDWENEDPEHPMRCKLKTQLQVALDAHTLPWGPTESEFSGLVDTMTRRATRMMPNHQTYFTLMEMEGMLTRAKQYKLSTNCVELAIAIVPNSLRAHFRLGNLLFQMQQYEDASMHFLHAIQLVRECRAVDVSPTREDGKMLANTSELLPQVLVNLGVTMEQSGMMLNAVSYYREAVASCPSHSRAHKLLGSCLLGLGELRSAKTALCRAVELSPHFADAYCDLGSTLQALGEDADAEAALLTAISLNPEKGHSSATFNLGNIKLKAGDFKLARTLYQEVLAYEPDHWRARLNRAIALLGMGEIHHGAAEFHIVHRMLGEHPELGNVLLQEVLRQLKVLQEGKHTQPLDRLRLLHLMIPSKMLAVLRGTTQAAPASQPLQLVGPKSDFLVMPTLCHATGFKCGTCPNMQAALHMRSLQKSTALLRVSTAKLRVEMKTFARSVQITKVTRAECERMLRKLLAFASAPALQGAMRAINEHMMRQFMSANSSPNAIRKEEPEERVDVALIFSACAILSSGTTQEAVSAAFDALLWQAGKLTQPDDAPSTTAPLSLLRESLLLGSNWTASILGRKTNGASLVSQVSCDVSAAHAPNSPAVAADVPSPAQRQGSKKPDNTEEVSPPITPDAAIAGVSNAEGKDLADPPVVPNIELEDSRTSPEANSYAKSAWLGTLQSLRNFQGGASSVDAPGPDWDAGVSTPVNRRPNNATVTSASTLLYASSAASPLAEFPNRVPGGSSTPRPHGAMKLLCAAAVPYAFVQAQFEYLTNLFCQDKTHVYTRSLQGLQRLRARSHSATAADQNLISLSQYTKLFSEHFPYLSDLHQLVRTERCWHNGTECAACSVQIVGMRFQCTNSIPKFNLCSHCYAEGRIPVHAVGKEAYQFSSHTST